MDIDAALARLTAGSWYRGQIGNVGRAPAAPARHRSPVQPLRAELARYLEGKGLELYTHQAQALDAWCAGNDFVIAAPTAGGKSLGFNLPVADMLLDDREATALYLYPTKALAQDQLAVLRDIDEALDLRARPDVYDGDTPAARRRTIRDRSRIVVSNPYGIHEYLPQHASWQRFLSHLAVVVVDEAHRYRGVFGSHVAYVLRRVRRLAAALGAEPRMVLASATIANPGEHASALTGKRVVVVDDAGSPLPPRAVALWDSMRDPDRSAATQAAGIVATLASLGNRTLCFTGSRVGAESVARAAAAMAPGLRLSAYRAGYRPAERRELERQLRSGELDALVSTNALELGIDISGLDAVVLTGYPGTIASTWQQVGRAGRAGEPALAVLVAGDDPLDQYFIRRPAVLFGAPVERAAVALGNNEVLSGQLLCASAELPVRPGEEHELIDAEMAAPAAAELERLAAESLVAATRNGYVYTGTGRPASEVHLDGRGDDSVEIFAGDELIEVVERWRALRTAFPGAILLHRGQGFRIEMLDLEAGRAEAAPISTSDHTQPIVDRQLEVVEATRQRSVGSWHVSLGGVRISERVTGYVVIHRGQVVGRHALDLPPHLLSTAGLWMSPGEGLGDGSAEGSALAAAWGEGGRAPSTIGGPGGAGSAPCGRARADPRHAAAGDVRPGRCRRPFQRGGWGSRFAPRRLVGRALRRAGRRERDLPDGLRPARRAGCARRRDAGQL